MSETGDIQGLSIALQPVHDAAGRHVADQLLYRRLEASGEDPVAAAARALATAIYGLDEQQRPGERALIVDLPLEWLERPDLLPPPAQRVILDLSETLAREAAERDLLVPLRERGYRLLLPAASLAEETPLSALADLVRLPHPEALAAERLQALRRRGTKLLATAIADPERLARFQALACDYYDGRYLAEPSFYATRRRDRHGNRAAHLRLINELYRDDIALQRLYERILQMPQLHLGILRRANSPLYAQGDSRHSDLKRAIQRLGLNELRRLVMTLSLAGELPSSRLRLRLALTRAFMCRNLAAPFPHLDPEAAFTAGLFSMMGPLLDESQEALLAELPLDEALSAALTRRSGPLGALLALAEGYEQQRETNDDTAAEHLQACYREAIAQSEALMGLL